MIDKIDFKKVWEGFHTAILDPVITVLEDIIQVFFIQFLLHIINKFYPIDLFDGIIDYKLFGYYVDNMSSKLIIVFFQSSLNNVSELRFRSEREFPYFLRKHLLHLVHRMILFDALDKRFVKVVL